MPRDSDFTSIADVLAAAEKKSREEAAKLKLRMLSAGAANDGPVARASRTPAPAPSADLMDDFDYAIQAVDTARRSISHDPAAVEKAAVTILVAKRRIAAEEAADLIRRAIRYLDG
jgi:hypothetical protein